MQLGALKHFIWAHNKLSETASFSTTLRAIQRIFMKPYLQGTALEAMQVGAELLVGSQLSLAQTRSETDAAMADAFRFSLRRRIDRGWKERRKLTTETADNLTCFAETAPRFNESTKLIEIDPQGCSLEDSCCLAAKLRQRPKDLEALLKAIEGKSRPEDNKRRQTLHLLKNTPKREVSDTACRALGDAYFALRCPTDCAILTTNVKDHSVLAGALHKKVDQHKA
ncbi:MAG TPA: hypothetical protein VMD97_01735 [Candidatus Aquilonibacter sp.]|nr:hypothetical protein [Candidatus Aquilonibacter sp.]